MRVVQDRGRPRDRVGGPTEECTKVSSAFEFTSADGGEGELIFWHLGQRSGRTV